MSGGLNGAAAQLQLDSTPPSAREFEFSDHDFRSLSKLAYEHAGIVLAESKSNLVYSRLSRRLRALRLNSFSEYREYLDTHEAETEAFINSISTNLTKFFRESHHFDHLRTTLAAAYAKRPTGRLRLWSAGCSTGEEPYSIGMVLAQVIAGIERHDVRILASDIDTDVVAKAALGQYGAESVADVPEEYRSCFGEASGTAHRASVAIDDTIKSLIAFRRLNLLGPWPFSGQFDAIFCRNVMIYFDAPTKAALVDRFIQALKPGGWLYIGHSESLMGPHPGVKLIGRTIYRREA